MDALDRLRTWYHRNYCSKWMTLVLQANLSLDQLETYAVDIFENIPTRGKDKPEGHPYTHSGFEKELFMHS